MRCLRLAICSSGLVLASCAGQTPKTTGGLDLPLQPSQYPGTLVYRAPDIPSGKYKSIFVDNADIYRAADAEFGGASEEDKARLAEKLSTEFKNALTKHKYTLVSQSGPGVVRLHLILAGVKESKPVAATVLRLTPLGLGASAAKRSRASWPPRARSPSTSPRGWANCGRPSSASSAAPRISPRHSIATSTGLQHEARR